MNNNMESSRSSPNDPNAIATMSLVVKGVSEGGWTGVTVDVEFDGLSVLLDVEDGICSEVALT